MAVIPFDMILNSSQFNQLIRIVRIGRLYKLAKLTRLFRMLKLAKSHKVWLEKISKFFKVSPGLSRLIFFLFISIIIIHVVACLWIMYPQFASEAEDQSKFYEGTWLEPYYDMEYTNSQLYITSVYWTITTVTAVGYGDITGNLVSERMFSIVIVIMGCCSFSFVSGSLASILYKQDDK